MNWPQLFLMTVLASAPPGDLPGKYVAVTETEYSIELSLAPSGDAELTASISDAEPESQPVTAGIKGRWVRTSSGVRIDFDKERYASFNWVACLSYEEFGRTGCSPGLKLLSTNLPDSWELQRFGLWRWEELRVGA